MELATFIARGYAYDPDSGVFTRRGKVVSNRKGNGYVGIGRQYAHRLAWLFVHGRWPHGDIDHINGDKLDNRIGNLRECSRSENQRNHGLTTRNRSGFKGVSQRRDRWIATIVVHGKQSYLGTFEAPEQAAIAYLDAAVRLHGEFRYRGEM